MVSEPTADAVAIVVRLQDVQARMDELRRERDEMIVALHGKCGVRELARWLGTSPAQISRIQNRPKEAT